MASLNSVKTWDEEVDVLICGYGCAGASAAIETYDLDSNARLLVIEKAPQEFAGGNCRVSGQSLLISKDKEALKDYQRSMSTSNPIPEDMLDTWAERMVNLEPWIQQIAKDADAEFLRGTGFTDRDAVLEFPELGARDAVAYTSTILPIPSGVWLALKANVEKRNIPVWFDCPLVDLIQDPDTLEVFGAWVEHDGVRKAIRALNGVIMAVGGYEADREMQRNYYGLSDVVPLGTPYNTGDGVRILQKAGAEMWHLRNQGQSGGIWPGIHPEGQKTAYLRNFLLPAFSWVDVDSTGKRFYNEANELQLTHYKEKKHGRWIDVPLHFAHPSHMIFDESTRLAGKMVTEVMTWAAVVTAEGWSEDNSEEIASGLIKKADTIAELAQQIGLDPEVLEAEIAKYNASCEAGHDEALGRNPDTLLPIANGPFYALPLTPVIVCTGGGARRNMDGQVFDHKGKVIPRLFEAGELGSMFSDLYQNGSYLTEAMITGRGAARSALAMEPAQITEAAE
ncbi:FAD-dependent oxidoreductase [Parasphingorhabdus sp.]|uniref:FAD-dependent oxidoreductase n=1 Tax=Parasphingorhabdus sp. TaxID=2709688 RepID=UPI002F929951